jgi:hypothetical protein
LDGSRFGLAWGGDKRRREWLAWWLKRKGKESRHLRALSLEMTIVELLSM